MKSNFVNSSHKALVGYLNALIAAKGKSEALQVIGELSDRQNVCRFVIFHNGEIADILEATIMRDSVKMIKGIVLERVRSIS